MSGMMGNDSPMGVRLIVAGGRDLLVDSGFVNSCIEVFRIKIDEIISGGAPGVDTAGEEYSLDFLDKEARVFTADWTRGVSAGPARNAKMAEYADALLLIWDGQSEGSLDMKREMLKKKKKVYEIIVRSFNE